MTLRTLDLTELEVEVDEEVDGSGSATSAKDSKVSAASYSFYLDNTFLFLVGDCEDLSDGAFRFGSGTEALLLVAFSGLGYWAVGAPPTKC